MWNAILNISMALTKACITVYVLCLQRELLLDRSQTTTFTGQVLRQVYLLRGFLAMAAEQWDVSGP